MWLSVIAWVVLSVLITVLVLVVTVQSVIVHCDLPRMELPPSSWDVPFPVDVVITWVDLSDKAWWERYRAAREAYGQPIMEHCQPNSSNTEVVDAVESVLHYWPWVRYIWLVTQRPQKPPLSDAVWQDARVRLIHHDEFVQTAELPTYNGMVTTSETWRITGLASHFVQLDDDEVVTKAVGPGYFFTVWGQPVIRPQWGSRWHASPKHRGYGCIVYNTLEMLPRPPKFLYLDSNHAPTPCRRDLCRAAFHEFQQRLPQALAPIRSTQDSDFLAVFLPNWLMQTKRDELRVVANRHCRFAEGSRFTASQHQAWLRDPQIVSVCINNAPNDEARAYLEDLRMVRNSKRSTTCVTWEEVDKDSPRRTSNNLPATTDTL